MKPSSEARFFEEQLMQDLPHLNYMEAAYFRKCHDHHARNEEDYAPIDFSEEIEALIRQALCQRYWIVRTHFTPDVYGSTNERLFEDCTISLPHEAATVAATLALNPKERVEWEAVEAWSWVYRHALLQHVEIHDFEKWCERQSPEPSRRFVLSALTQSSGRAKLLHKGAPTISDAALGNA